MVVKVVFSELTSGMDSNYLFFLIILSFKIDCFWLLMFTSLMTLEILIDDLVSFDASSVLEDLNYTACDFILNCLAKKITCNDY